MKATLEFNLPDDQAEFEAAANATKYFSVLWEMDQWLRSNIKYAPDDMNADRYHTYEECREKLREIMSDNNVSFK